MSSGRLLGYYREKFFPRTYTHEIFADVAAPHRVVATKYTYPFTHAVIDNFLPDDLYADLEKKLQDILLRGVGPAGAQGTFARFDLYDLYSYMPRPTLAVPYGCFFSLSYIEMLEKLLTTSVSRDTFLTFHHHKPSEKDNYIHTDYGPGYFVDDPLPNGVNPWFLQCNHTQPSPQVGVRKMVRAIAAIYYLNNDGWHEGMGGETGVFSSRETSSLIRAIAPINNRLLIMAITPYSFHNFKRNMMQSRNSIAQWFFISEEEARIRFPIAAPAPWKI